MRKNNLDVPKPAVTRLRCAIYTRKSTEEGLDQEFNSLDAQREAAEAFIQSQRREGWIALPELYDDGGFTGANMDRPALTRLLLTEIARISVESQRLSTLIRYATAIPFAIGFLEAALAIDESNNGIWRNPITFRNCRSATSRPEPTHRSI